MATYYIDFAGGNDANPGTKASPWKLCPGMVGAPARAHTAGDQFIFKGGVTWPASCFPFTINVGGSVGTPDIYGTDPAWPSANWSRAVFDFENSFTTAGYGVGIQASNVTFGNGMDLKRLKSPTYFGGGGTITSNGSFTGIRITGAIIRDWCLATPIADNTGGSGGGVICYGAVIKIDHCELHQQNSATISGVVAYNVNDVSFCEIHHCAEALHGGGSYHDNHIHDLLTPTNPNGEHTAAIVTYVPSTIYNNLIHDLSGNAAPVELWGATSSAVSNSTDILYNNVIYRAGVQPCIWIGNDSTLYNTHTVKLYNNTLDAGSGFCFSNRASTNAALGTLDARNNHFVTTGTAININNPSQLGGPVTNLTAPTQPTTGGNLIQTPTQATAAGYTATLQYQPPNGSGATVNVGTDLSSVFTADRLGNTRSAPWDVGAYEFNGGGGGGGTTVVTCAPASIDFGWVAVGSTQSVPVTISNSGTVTANLSFSATGPFHFAGTNYMIAAGGNVATTVVYAPTAKNVDSGTIGVGSTTLNLTGKAAPVLGLTADPTQGLVIAPMSVGTGWVGSASETTLGASGVVAWYFSITVAGDYVINTSIDAPFDYQNSLFVGVDTEPTDPVNIWDVHPLTTQGVPSPRTVNWRGNGDSEVDQFTPNVWTLGVGQHLLIFRSREANTRLYSVTVAQQHTPDVIPKGVIMLIGGKHFL